MTKDGKAEDYDRLKYEFTQISQDLKIEKRKNKEQANKLRIGDLRDTLILTPKDAEVFFNEIMNPKDANEALKQI